MLKCWQKKENGKDNVSKCLSRSCWKRNRKKEKVKTIWSRGTPSVVLVLLIDKKHELEHTYHITF